MEEIKGTMLQWRERTLVPNPQQKILLSSFTTESRFHGRHWLKRSLVKKREGRTECARVHLHAHPGVELPNQQYLCLWGESPVNGGKAGTAGSVSSAVVYMCNLDKIMWDVLQGVERRNLNKILGKYEPNARVIALIQNSRTACVLP